MCDQQLLEAVNSIPSFNISSDAQLAAAGLDNKKNKKETIVVPPAAKGIEKVLFIIFLFACVLGATSNKKGSKQGSTAFEHTIESAKLFVTEVLRLAPALQSLPQV